MWKSSRTVIAGLAISALSGTAALADDKPAKQSDPPTASQREQTPSRDRTPTGDTAQRRDAAPSGDMPVTMSTSDVMKISQQALAHIATAEKAIDAKQTAKAKSALDKSEQALERLYDTPALAAVLNEIDEALRQMQTGKPALKAVDLAPLTASVRTYQAYLDPEVAAGIQEAEQRAKQGDAKAATDALRLARNRVVVDMAFLPVEEAYVRVLAAQSALDDGDRERAAKILRTLPIVVSEVQVSTPLVPVRFKLSAAALATEQGNKERARILLKDAANDMKELERLSAQSASSSEIRTLANELEQLNKRVQAGQTASAEQLRDLVKRTRDVGEA